MLRKISQRKKEKIWEETERRGCRKTEMDGEA
jgi:hypothetical protein